MHRLIQLAEESSLRENPLNFEIGDTVDVHTRILEGTKERIQIFSGVVIARSGAGVRETFTVRRIVAGEGVERTFPLHSPKVAEVEVKRHARVKRAKLYYLRDRIGKATRLTERRAKTPAAKTKK
ncbi:MAG: 50S ribosomal protein L19 [Planctomycetota bacterium]|nr:MAG: 50S ribosomal protein L19 [Planctomycetota bacterium]REJ95200.1 MAG: 50S ribosomal protein L19 [Planctomycetota bacterium]REK25045.1 MAG: 50S ribosomal protein L19 [Planctomycetota bacterium]REK28110.1 MAG: 50S ribosomal protein L19 [Planctomycetota bacterium]